MRYEIIDSVRKVAPIVHNITNYVTVNDCANILLACGASPIMADDATEVEEITSISNALVINIGTLNERTIPAMIKAGRKSNELKHPVILDPVGAGASKLRSDTTLRLLREIHFDVIRGNISEIKSISMGLEPTNDVPNRMGSGSTMGVDADTSDRVTEDNLTETILFAQKLFDRIGSVIVITGAIDIIADNKKAFIIRNGHPSMSKITGTGCMLTSLIGAFCAADPTNIVDATAVAVCTMGLCGEKAYKKMLQNDSGTSSLRMYLIDYMSKIDSKVIEEGAKVERVD